MVSSSSSSSSPQFPMSITSYLIMDNNNFFLQKPAYEHIFSTFKENPEVLKAYKTWSKVHQNLVQNFVCLKKIDYVVEQVESNASSLTFKIEHLALPIIDKDHEYSIEDKIELIEISILDFHTIKKTSEEAELIANGLSVKKIKTIIGHNVSSIVDTILNHLNLEKTIPLLKALVKKGEEKSVVQILNYNINGCSILHNRSATKLSANLLEKIFSLLNLLQPDSIYLLLSEMDSRNYNTPLFDPDIFYHVVPLLLAKITPENIIKLLKIRNMYGSALYENFEIALNMPMPGQKALLKSDVLSLEQIRDALFLTSNPKYFGIKLFLISEIIDNDFFATITGFDFDIEKFAKEKRQGTNTTLGKDLFLWAINKPIEKQVECFEFVLSLGGLQEFLWHVRALNQDDQYEFLNRFNTEVLAESLLYENTSQLLDLYYDDGVINILNFLAKKENGHLYLKKILKADDENNSPFIDDPRILPFLNQIIADPIGYSNIKNSFIFSRQPKELLEKLNLTSDQFFEILQLRDSDGPTLLSKCAGQFTLGEFFSDVVLQKLDSKQIITLLSLQNSEGCTEIWGWKFYHMTPLLIKILHDPTIDGFEKIKKLFSIKNKEGNTVAYYNVENILPFLNELAKVEGGIEFIKTLLTEKQGNCNLSPLDIEFESISRPSSNGENVFLMLGNIFTYKEILELLDKQSKINFDEKRTLLYIKAIPLFKKIAEDEASREYLRNQLIPLSGTGFNPFLDYEFMQEAGPLLAKLQPSKDFIAKLFSRNGAFLSLLFNNRERLNEIVPLVENFSSHDILQMIQHKDNFGSYLYYGDSPKLLVSFANFLVNFMDSNDLIHFLLIKEAKYFYHAMFSCYLSKEVLQKAFGLDFDTEKVSKNTVGDTWHTEKTNLIKAVTDWVESKQGVDKAKALILPLLFFYGEKEVQYRNQYVKTFYNIFQTLSKELLQELLIQCSHLFFSDAIFQEFYEMILTELYSGNQLHEALEADDPFLMHLDSHTLLKLLTTPDNDKKTPLHSSEIFQSAQKLLFKLQSDIHPFFFKDVYSLKDSHGNTPLHSPESFATFLPILMSLDPLELKRILKIRNNEDEYVIKFALLSDTLNKGMLEAVGIHDFVPTKGMTQIDILDWVNSHTDDEKRAKSLYLPFLLGYTDSVVQILDTINKDYHHYFYEAGQEKSQELKNSIEHHRINCLHKPPRQFHDPMGV